MTILFLSDENGYAHKNPSATLVRVVREVTAEELKQNEVGDRFTGGRWKDTLEKMGIAYKVLFDGKFSILNSVAITPDLTFKLFSGNY